MARQIYFGYFVPGDDRPRGVARVEAGDDLLRLEVFTKEGWVDEPQVLNDLKEPDVKEITQAQAEEVMARISGA
jgi:hypothetical protein